MAYGDWHREPGYARDVTRHFAPEARILDVGCGSAWLGRYFSNYTGADASPDLVAAAIAEGRNVLLHDVADGLPFEDESFDGVILKDLLEHLLDPVAVVSEARRVLRQGGRVFASSPDAQRWVWDDYTHRRPFTRKAMRMLFSDRGFRVERVSYECVAPGTSIVSGWTRRKRRPRLLQILVYLRFVRRNVWIIARRDDHAG